MTVAPASSGGFVAPWTAYLKRLSKGQADSFVKDTLNRRLKNLLDRNLINSEGRTYSITKTGLDYLKRVGTATGTGTPEVPAGIQRYADNDDGRMMLAAFADSIAFAHSLDPECWVTLFAGTHRDMRLYVGSTLMMVLEARRERVELTLLSGDLEDEQRESVRSAQVLREYTFPEGARALFADVQRFHRTLGVVEDGTSGNDETGCHEASAQPRTSHPTRSTS